MENATPSCSISKMDVWSQSSSLIYAYHRGIFVFLALYCTLHLVPQMSVQLSIVPIFFINPLPAEPFSCIGHGISKLFFYGMRNFFLQYCAWGIANGSDFDNLPAWLHRTLLQIVFLNSSIALAGFSKVIYYP